MCIELLQVLAHLLMLHAHRLERLAKLASIGEVIEPNAHTGRYKDELMSASHDLNLYADAIIEALTARYTPDTKQ